MHSFEFFLRFCCIKQLNFWLYSIDHVLRRQSQERQIFFLYIIKKYQVVVQHLFIYIADKWFNTTTIIIVMTKIVAHQQHLTNILMITISSIISCFKQLEFITISEYYGQSNKFVIIQINFLLTYNFITNKSTQYINNKIKEQDNTPLPDFVQSGKFSLKDVDFQLYTRFSLLQGEAKFQEFAQKFFETVSYSFGLRAGVLRAVNMVWNWVLSATYIALIDIV
eukprot:TRINITY_DN4657_c0_g1_i3.p2 TRINITY_DN4657_c0_g1~~TRINITY_DN4657_c0_g1_i3.p2  ORF type:complete len:223 (-),score=-12.80 TRINITY_DN4657_c0_g1_i3:237-905(-)